MCLGLNLEAWGVYQAKEKLSSDTKYDAKLKGLSLKSKECKEISKALTVLHLVSMTETEMEVRDRTKLEFWI